MSKLDTAPTSQEIAEWSPLATAPDRVEANARLIAAAPDLLEGLQGVMSLIESGRLRRNTSDDPEPDWALRQLPLIMALKRAQMAIDKALGTAPLDGGEATTKAKGDTF